MLRTHTCGQLRGTDDGSSVTLCGWVHSIRDFGGAIFLILRDRYGVVQTVVEPESPEAVRELARQLKVEYVIQVVGKVARRPVGQENAKMPTGEVEVRLESIEILNTCHDLPLIPGDPEIPSEDIRLRHRYLDLRRPTMQHNLILRHRIIKTMRDYFDEHQFLEIETPILGRSTPEGARDYLVPSRVHPGSFYALPQSPQIYKQIMMIAGYDRYVQVARCFRDEDLRADRQPEFTQLDLEMSFVDSGDVMAMIDGLMARLADQILGIKLTTPLPRITYDEAMRRFGHDAPDLRYGMEIVDITDLAKLSGFRVFQEVAQRGDFVRGLCLRGGAASLTRKRIDQLTSYVQQDFQAKGLAWMKVDDQGEISGPIAKNFEPALLQRIAERMEAKPGDAMLWVADSWDVSCRALNGLRRRLAAEEKLYDPRSMHFSWIVEFPMFQFDAETKGWVAMHHPFTAPRDQDLARLLDDPGSVRAKAYDLVINGFEAGGGTIRIHDAQTQQQVFQLMGLDLETARYRFGFLLDALKYGAPPHGGIALGIDRVAMLFAGLDNIRDCIAFPKTARATDLMSGAPSEVELQQIRELGISLQNESRAKASAAS